MTRKTYLRNVLITAMFFAALGGWLLHLRVHPVGSTGYSLVPFAAGVLSVFILPLMFCFKNTLPYAYVLNGMLVIIGTITMAHFGYAHFNGPVTVSTLFTRTMFPDIALAWSKFAIGKALFDLNFLKSDTDPLPKGRYFRYPNMGWWWVHFAGMTLVYSLGHILWK